MDLSALNLERKTLHTLEKLLDEIQDKINQNPEDGMIFLCNRKNEIKDLKLKRNKPTSDLIHANVQELKSAFEVHRSIVGMPTLSRSASICLLTFYAVECGLKAIWLKRNKLKGTKDIQDQTRITKDGHNFSIWMKELRLPATLVGNYPEYAKIPNFHLLKDKSSWDIGKAHQAWRYGVKINLEDEQSLVLWLENICTWIKDDLYF